MDEDWDERRDGGCDVPEGFWPTTVAIHLGKRIA